MKQSAWISLMLSLWVGCSFDLHPVPRNADPKERRAVAVLKPLAEYLAWDKDGNVWTLDITGAEITPEVLDAIVDLKELCELNLIGTNIRDDQLAKLKGLPKLDSLGLQWTCVSDAGVDDLVEIKSLKCVDLSHSRITDKGLAVLARKGDLTHIFLAGTQTSEEAIAKLRQALPECYVQD